MKNLVRMTNVQTSWVVEMQAQEALIRWVRTPERLLLSRQLQLLKDAIHDDRMLPVASSIIIHSERLDLVLRDLHDAISSAVYHEFQTALENSPFPTQHDNAAIFPPPPPPPHASYNAQPSAPPSSQRQPSSSSEVPPAEIPPPLEAFPHHHSHISAGSTSEEEEEEDFWPDPESEEEAEEEDEEEGEGPPPLSEHDLELLTTFEWGFDDSDSLAREDGDENGVEDGEENGGEHHDLPNIGDVGDVVAEALVELEEVSEDAQQDGSEVREVGSEEPEEGAQSEGDEDPTHSRDCAICHDVFVNGQHMRRLRCNHVFHKRCVDRWLTEQRSTCPLCRMDQRTVYMV